MKLKNITILSLEKEKAHKEAEEQKKQKKHQHQHSARLSAAGSQYKDTSGESSQESDEEEEIAERVRMDQSDLPSEYWQIQKLVKYLKVICKLLFFYFLKNFSVN